MGQVYIYKASGEREPFAEEKLRNSLMRSGAAPDIAEKIIKHIKDELHEGMTTSEIYTHAFDLLKKSSRYSAGRFYLKKAVMELGPDGHSFEVFVGEIMKSMGYSVEVARIVSGQCVAHEVDVVGRRDGHHVMVECKYHNQPGAKTDVKVALYIQARFEDVRKRWEADPKDGDRFHEAWLITNTKLTTDAIKYGKCVGMKVIGWSYPKGASLERVIEGSGLHPVTSLTSLTRESKRALLDRKVVLCREIVENPAILREIGLNDADSSAVIEEARELSVAK